MEGDLYRQIKSLLEGASLGPDEAQRRLMLVRPLWDAEARGAFGSAAEMSHSTLLSALRAAFGDNAMDVPMVVFDRSEILARPLPFPADARTQEVFAIACRDASYKALRASTERNIVFLLHEALPEAVCLVRDTTTMTPELDSIRYNVLGRCLSDMSRPGIEDIRAGLLFSYLHATLKGREQDRERLERICALAATRCVPYGVLRTLPPKDQPAFVWIAGHDAFPPRS